MKNDSPLWVASSLGCLISTILILGVYITLAFGFNLFSNFAGGLFLTGLCLLGLALWVYSKTYYLVDDRQFYIALWIYLFLGSIGLVAIISAAVVQVWSWINPILVFIKSLGT